MVLIKDGLCWKWRTERGTYVHAFWECCKVFPFWRRCLGLYGPPMSARLWGALLQLNRFVVRASMVCFVTCARLWDYFQILKTHWTNDGQLLRSFCRVNCKRKMPKKQLDCFYDLLSKDKGKESFDVSDPHTHSMSLSDFFLCLFLYFDI